MADTQIYRKLFPNPAGIPKKNGFFMGTLQDPAEINIAYDAGHLRDLDEDQRKLITERKERKLRDAIEKHREADEVLEASGCYFPG